MPKRYDPKKIFDVYEIGEPGPEAIDEALQIVLDIGARQEAERLQKERETDEACPERR